MSRPPKQGRSQPVDRNRPPSANYHANALARGLALLEQLAAGAHPLSLNDFADATGLPKSTLVRLLSVLSELEYVVRVDDRPSYRLGHKVQDLGTAYVNSLDLSVVAAQYLSPLARRTGQTANLGVLDGAQVLHVCVSEPDRPLHFTASPGTRDDAYCTGLGKLLLAHLARSRLHLHTPPEPFPRFTDHTITSQDQLVRELRRTVRRGYAVDDNERSVGLRRVAVPVMLDDACLAAVSVSGPAAEFSSQRQEDYATQLTEVAAELVADAEFAAGLRIVSRSLRSMGQNSSRADYDAPR